MRWNGFGRSVVFAALAAAGLAPFTLLVSPWLSQVEALLAYAWLSAAIYPLGLGASVRRGLAGSAITLAAAAGVALVDPGARATLIAAAVSLAVVRSGALYARRLPRAIVIETGFVLGGLAIANALLGASILSTTLAIWGFYLVQSVFFLVGGSRWERRARVPADPFEAARDRALAILDDTA
jgi:hypothetical protein